MNINEMIKAAEEIAKWREELVASGRDILPFDEKAATLIAAMAEELKEFKEANEAMMLKLGDNCCACSVDKKTDICMAHQPRITELEEELKKRGW